jgi:hypothetical protein
MTCHDCGNLVGNSHKFMSDVSPTLHRFAVRGSRFAVRGTDGWSCQETVSNRAVGGSNRAVAASSDAVGSPNGVVGHPKDVVGNPNEEVACSNTTVVFPNRRVGFWRGRVGRSNRPVALPNRRVGQPNGPVGLLPRSGEHCPPDDDGAPRRPGWAGNDQGAGDSVPLMTTGTESPYPWAFAPESDHG